MPSRAPRRCSWRLTAPGCARATTHHPTHHLSTHTYDLLSRIRRLTQNAGFRPQKTLDFALPTLPLGYAWQAALDSSAPPPYDCTSAVRSKACLDYLLFGSFCFVSSLRVFPAHLHQFFSG